MKAEKVIVFGASSGIGLASARLLAARGYAVTAVGRNQRKLDQAAVETSMQCAAVDAS
jgi:short-subunit dehydrogenase